MKSFFTILDKVFEDITGPIKSMFNVWIKDATISGILLVICLEQYRPYFLRTVLGISF